MAANVMLSLDIFSISDLMAHHILHEFPSDVPELQPPLPSANVEDNSIRDVQSFAKAYPENLIPIGDSYCSKDLQQPVEVPVYHPIMGYAQQLAHRFTRADNWLSKVGPPRVFVDKENKFEAFLDEGQWNVTTQLVAGQGAMPPSRLWKVNRILEANKRTVGCIMYDDDSRDQNRNVASADRLLRSESICAFALAARQFQKYPDVHSMTVTLINFTASAMRVVQGGFVSCGHLKQPIVSLRVSWIRKIEELWSLDGRDVTEEDWFRALSWLMVFHDAAAKGPREDPYPASADAIGTHITWLCSHLTEWALYGGHVFGPEGENHLPSFR